MVSFREGAAELEPQVWYEAAGGLAAGHVERIDFSSLYVGWSVEGRRVGPVAVRSEEGELLVLDAVGDVPPGLTHLLGYSWPTDEWLEFCLPDPAALVGMLLADQETPAVLTVLVDGGREFAFLVSPCPVSGRWKWLFVSSPADEIVAVRYDPIQSDQYAVAEVIVGTVPEPAGWILFGLGTMAIPRRGRRAA